MDLLTQVVAGIILLAIAGLLWTRHRVNECVVTVRRAWNDYWLWSYEAGKRRYAEFQRQKRVHADKGTLASEEHLAEAEALVDRYADEFQTRMRKMSRDIDDAFRRLRRIDRIFLLFTYPGASFKERMNGLWRSFTNKPFSLEEMYDRVLQTEREGKLDQFLQDLVQKIGDKDGAV